MFHGAFSLRAQRAAGIRLCFMGQLAAHLLALFWFYLQERKEKLASSPLSFLPSWESASLSFLTKLSNLATSSLMLNFFSLKSFMFTMHCCTSNSKWSQEKEEGR